MFPSPRRSRPAAALVPTSLVLALALVACTPPAGEGRAGEDVGAADQPPLDAPSVGSASGAADPLATLAAERFGALVAPTQESVHAPLPRLGRALFWDERLSADGQTSCASCHTVEGWGSDPRIRPVDARGQPTPRHSQTVFNAMGQPSIRWLGDRETGAIQATGSLAGAMGFARAEDVLPLLDSLGYGPAFREAFPGVPEPLTPEHYGLAIEAYEATLMTPAPFDAWLAGDSGALTPFQREGLELFVSTGCVACHSGPLLGGTSWQRFGIVEDYWTATGSEGVDPGRFALTGDEGDRYVFRTPMLRNIARTAPYFHDGSVEALEEAVRIMARVQLGRTLEEGEVERIAAFLESLTGEVPAHYAPPGKGPVP